MPETEPTAESRRASREAREAARRARRRKTLVVVAVAACALIALGLAAWLLLRPHAPASSSATTTATATQTAAASATVEPTTAPPAAEQTPAVTPTPTADAAATAGDFDVSLAKKYDTVLAKQIGVREAGTEGEREAAKYIAGELERLGYAPTTQIVPLPNGRTSRNVIATLEGTGTRRVVLGAHYDTKKPSPGANDNGSGSAALLAIASELRDETLAPTVVFVWFGDEEMIDSNQDHHHYGSRAYVAEMSKAEKAATAAMISVDMIGYGPEFRVRTMGKGPQTLQKDLLAYAKTKGFAASYLKDTGKYGFSDHEPFELAGIPAAWIEWRDDPTYHSEKDDLAHIDWEKVRQAGQLTLGYVRALDEARMKTLLGG